MDDQVIEGGTVTDNTVKFDAIDARFEYGNEEWALANLPKIRIASHMLQRNDIELADSISKMVTGGIVPDTLDGLIATRDHMKALAEMIDVALTRSFVVLDRLGFSPDCPPPDKEIVLQ